jgi:hypothetical protein
MQNMEKVGQQLEKRYNVEDIEITDMKMVKFNYLLYQMILRMKTLVMKTNLVNI